MCIQFVARVLCSFAIDAVCGRLQAYITFLPRSNRDCSKCSNNAKNTQYIWMWHRTNIDLTHSEEPCHIPLVFSANIFVKSFEDRVITIWLLWTRYCANIKFVCVWDTKFTRCVFVLYRLSSCQILTGRCISGHKQIESPNSHIHLRCTSAITYCRVTWTRQHFFVEVASRVLLRVFRVLACLDGTHVRCSCPESLAVVLCSGWGRTVGLPQKKQEGLGYVQRSYNKLR